MSGCDATVDPEASTADGATDEATAGAAPRLGSLRQPIVKAGGKARRARLLPAPDTDPNPHPPVLREDGGVASVGSVASANDARLRQDRPPHW
ncbi:hypothetical protein [Cryobacterium sp. PH31-O1]|uniref:hypothetical protein n=1 Tax=Cryobacterium sp. PH31-O1 TaxID=3046306 RepID=UPI0024B8D39D|nr:hypothetical protein [Cryobacterium sp. PH31-O1]MDJ0338283.1 hypothetical protein [Cryobacterium sp. PH31-O1]